MVLFEFSFSFVVLKIPTFGNIGQKWVTLRFGDDL
jgi:hypothetical protein